ncbi:MAG: enoyl-CoA hydratase/isomerase family protein [Nannocystaceae bacterium]|nr:enoyl-CoA hydratase/isomerase family protein [Nannocystaceae bacterium]
MLTLDRPSARNSLDRELLQALREALHAAAADAQVRAIILTGSGGSFCAGADLKKAMSEGLGDGMDARIDEFHAVIRALVETPQPVVAAIDGAAVGFGCDLALACDLRIASSRAYLQEKFVQIGLMPDGGGSFTLARLVGVGRALQLLLLGERVEADALVGLGLATAVVEPDALPQAALELATRLADGPPLALRAIKRAVRQGQDGTIEDALAREKAGQLALLRSEDVMNGVFAWMQGRKPEFKGR